MKRLFLLLLTTAIPMLTFAQFTISGTVENTAGEPLTGANVVLNNSYVIPTDEQGKFTIKNVQQGEHELKVTYIGYQPYQKRLAINNNVNFNLELVEQKILADEIIVTATRASEKIPTTYSTVTREEIEEKNTGQDIPFILQHEPSVVVTSDAGAGVGYTGMRIRGSDQTRINVTVNGIPVNDAESQGVFWVNMPDFASSVESIQIQRGLGTSTNGAGAFGGTVNIQTLTLNTQPYGEINNAYGSFNTRKHTIKTGTGLINDRFAFDIRLSNIASDGYIDRATSDLKSFYFSAGYHGKKNMLKAIIFQGKEKTYQSWYGLPEEMLETDRTFNYYTYDNEVDDYGQDHYQLHYSHEFSTATFFNMALHYTRGAGFFEQFRENDRFSNYALPNLIIGNDTIRRTDLIRRRWLDNHFYGTTFSLKYQPQDNFSGLIGGGWNNYIGDHFGEIIWARYAGNTDIRHRYYDNTGEKMDFNVFTKLNYSFTDALGAFLDLQFRRVDYNVAGIDNDLRELQEEVTYNFFNPKAGLNYRLNNSNNFYAFFGIGHREPDRNDFIDAIEGHEPQPEQLQNLEVGYRFQKPRFALSANFYLMNYNDQLVLTGELNDVGSPVRTNVDNSYRTGIELQAGFSILPNLELNANATFSRNKIKNYEEMVYVYDENFDLVELQTIVHPETDISFSPSIIAAAGLTFEPVKNLELALLSKYVGKQFLDNTSSDERALVPYFISDFRVIYIIKNKLFREIEIVLQANNLFNNLYESNGYTYGWFNEDSEGNRSREFYNFYYPQAGRHFMFGLNLRI